MESTDRSDHAGCAPTTTNQNEEDQRFHLYEVQCKNRVVYKRTASARRRGKRMRGRQGDWYPETRQVIAQSEEAAREMIEREILIRRILGRRSATIGKYFTREIEILAIRRLD